MNKFLALLLLIVILSSCVNKTLELPQVAVSGVSEIQNHSEIWVFYKHDTDAIKADINKNNTISTTHWILNIDKRLPLSEVIPVFHMIKAKRAKKSIHSSAEMKDYLSYSDIKDNKIALFSIDSIQYMLLPKSDIDQILAEKSCKNTIEFSVDVVKVNQKEIQANQWAKEQLENLHQGCIQLIFDEKLSYQDYMQYRLELSVFLKPNQEIEPTELIFK